MSNTYKQLRDLYYIGYGSLFFFFTGFIIKVIIERIIGGEVWSWLGMSIAAWYGFWYMQIMIVYTHLMYVSIYKKEKDIKDDIYLIKLYLFIYFIPPILLFFFNRLNDSYDRWKVLSNGPK